MKARDTADEVWAVIDGQATFEWEDLRESSPTSGAKASLSLREPTTVLVPFRGLAPRDGWRRLGPSSSDCRRTATTKNLWRSLFRVDPVALMLSRRDLLLLLRLSRPFFLLGGFLLYAVGVLAARWMGWPIDFVRYVQGQAIVSALQLVVHYSNEYFDAGGDAENPYRTPFSGGSGALGRDGLPRRAAAWATGIAAAGAVLVAGRMITTGGAPPLSWWVAGTISLGAWFYSAPPARLVARGLGEIAASIVVAVLVPVYAFALQTNASSIELAAAVTPLFLLHGAMLLVLEIPDIDADRRAGKRTLVVRLGVAVSLWLHLGLLLLAMAALAVARYVVAVPAPPIAIVLIAVAAGYHVWQVRRTVKTGQGWMWTAGLAVGLFALTALAEAVGFLTA